MAIRNFKNYIKRALAAALCALTLAPRATAANALEQSSAPFSDVEPGRWYSAGVLYCFEHGYMDGTGHGFFSPGAVLTRSMAVQMIARLVGVDLSEYAGYATFSDVRANAWYHDAVAWAKFAGITGGAGNGGFKPNGAVTRQDLAVMLFRAAQLSGARVGGRADLNRFTDAGDVSRYAVTALSWAVKNGIISGTGNGRIAPRDGATRAQTAQIFRKYDSVCGHRWGAGRVVKLRTCRSDGVTEFVCRDCGKKVTARTRGRHVFRREGNMKICVNCGYKKSARAKNDLVYVLMYHDVRDVPASECGAWTTTPARFRSDVKWLLDHGYTFCLPGQIASGEYAGRKPVMIIFDDGYRGVYEYAFPILREYGAKAAVALIGDVMERGDKSFLTWDMCRKMAAAGTFEFGAHTYALHRDGIGRLSGESRAAYEVRVCGDLDVCNDLIERELGSAVRFFAYPHGSVDSWAREYVHSRYGMSFTTVYGGAYLSRMGNYELPRFNMNASTDIADIMR